MPSLCLQLKQGLSLLLLGIWSVAHCSLQPALVEVWTQLEGSWGQGGAGVGFGDIGSWRGEGQLPGPWPCFEQQPLVLGLLVARWGLSAAVPGHFRMLAEQDEILGIPGALQRMAAHIFGWFSRLLMVCLNQTRWVTAVFPQALSGCRTWLCYHKPTFTHKIIQLLVYLLPWAP